MAIKVRMNRPLTTVTGYSMGKGSLAYDGDNVYMKLTNGQIVHLNTAKVVNSSDVRNATLFGLHDSAVLKQNQDQQSMKEEEGVPEEG